MGKIYDGSKFGKQNNGEFLQKFSKFCLSSTQRIKKMHAVEHIIR